VVLVLFVGGAVEAVLQSLGRQPYLDTGAGLDLDAYRALGTDPALRASIGLTLRLGLLATLVSTVLGVACAVLVHNLRRGRRMVSVVLQSSLPVPHLVGALCMLLLLSQSGLLSRLSYAAGLTDAPADFPALTNDGFGWAILAGYVWKETPFVAVVALSALSAGVRDLEDVARTLGAGRWRRLRHVVLPVLRPSVLSASVLVLAFTVGSYEVPLLLGRPYPAPLPVLAYQAYRDPDLAARPTAMAVSVLLTGLAAVLVAGWLALGRPRGRR
jgi:putative spermidine/putrescine transport system permease protein